MKFSDSTESALPDSDLIAIVEKLVSDGRITRHRRVVVLRGEQDWCRQRAEVIVRGFIRADECRQSEILDVEQCLGASRDDSRHRYHYKGLQANKLKSLLGSEWDLVFWNGFKSVNADGLGIVSGVIRAGGLLCLLLPNKDEQGTFVSSRFFRRLESFLTSDHEVLHLRQGASLKEIEKQCDDISRQSRLENVCENIDMFADQSKAVEAIIRVAEGHRRRPLVIQADRGRGKTAALGIAAAKLTNIRPRSIIITAPDRTNIEPALRFYTAEISGAEIHQVDNHSDKYFRFEPADVLLRQTDQNIDLLLVDEAAAFPVAVLKQLLERCSRVVFSTTVHGYEGSGRGFDIRFKNTLDQLTPKWKQLELTYPIRWAPQDPLEAFCSRLLVLDASPELSSWGEADAAFPNKRQIAEGVEWLSPRALAGDEKLLREVFGLLVLAHYKTRPGDLQFLLEEEGLTIGLLRLGNRVAGVILALKEGGIQDQSLVDEICIGKRRPVGNLAAQLLAKAYMVPWYLESSSFRVMRIAVHPQLHRQGIGSSLLASLRSYADAEKISWLSVSYGLTPELLKFWNCNQFSLVHLGFHRQASSQEFSAVGIYLPGSEPHMGSIRRQFGRTFEHTLVEHFCMLSMDMIADIIADLYGAQPLEKESLIFLDAFARGYRGYEETAAFLKSLIFSELFSQVRPLLSSEQLTVLIGKVLLRLPWSDIVAKTQSNITGKKQALESMRQTVGCLLSESLGR